MVGWLLIALANVIVSSALGQVPLTLVDAETQVRSIDFEFSGTRTFSNKILVAQIGLTDQGPLVGLRRRLSVVPIFPKVGMHPFLPVQMARDINRLEGFYQQHGFLKASADWRVVLDTTSNVVNVSYSIEEGPPLLIRDFTIATIYGGDPSLNLPEEIRREWVQFAGNMAKRRDTRLDDVSIVEIESDVLGWFQDNGYPFAQVESQSEVDDTFTNVSLIVEVEAGTRARVGRIDVEGTNELSANVIRRELPFREGELFNQSKLLEGQREVFGLEAVQLAIVEVPEDQPQDSTVDIRVRIREYPPRELSAQVGYFSETGLSGQAEWEHVNFFGGARNFNASLLANTSLASFNDEPNQRYRGSVTLVQPHFVNRRVSLSGGPYTEIRDDALDRSVSYGGNASITYEVNPVRSLSLGYNLELRNVTDLRAATFGNLFDLFQDEVEDLIAGKQNRTSATLSGVFGIVGNPTAYTQGIVARPRIDVTLPWPNARVEYARVSGTVTGTLPVTSSLSVRARISGGRLLPFGNSVPDETIESRLGEYLLLYDESFFSGGTGDVRGWGPNYLGPKVPDLAQVVVDGDSTLGSNDRYVPIGGYGKVAASVEARIALGSLGIFAFLDASKLWVDDSHDIFDVNIPMQDGPGTFPDDNRVVFFGTGFGFDFATPIGPVGLAFGFKVNPSNLDLRSAQEVGEFLVQSLVDPEFDQNYQDVPTSFLRRLHIHFRIGETF